LSARHSPRHLPSFPTRRSSDLQGGPLMHIIAFKAVCFGEALTDGFRAYQKRVVENAAVLAKGLTGRGFDLVSGGTDNHLVLLDLDRKSTRLNSSHLGISYAVFC